VVAARAIRTTVGVVSLIVLSGNVSIASRTNDRWGLTSEVGSSRNEASRTLTHEDSIIQRALLVLGQPVNPIRVVEPREIGRIYARAGVGPPPEGLTAFRAPHDASDPHIYVNQRSLVYQDAARTRSAMTVLILAGTLVHEQVHNTDRELAAYRLQADFVRGRLQSLPRRDHDAARQYVQQLDARARALAWAEWKRARH
jgi:hypothetical protein